jgi:cell division protein FtsW (lipid II flippase)
MLLVNNMLMLLSIGFVVIGRLDLSEALKQYVIASGATIIAFLVPVIIRKLHFLDKLTWLYAILGIASLLVVFALAVTSRGAKLSISIGGITVQFSEIVKITLVFFMAAKLTEKDPIPFRDVVITTIVAAAHVVILVLSTDLGTALVFFIAYIVVIYVATDRAVYPLAGLLGGSLAAVCAYFLFNHVRQRVEAWRNPFYNYDTTGYQISQSLFAIGAGGWFGTGLYLGRPETIPVASKDFVFSAICEEFGGVFAIALILICMNTFLLICNISLKIENRFYKLIALGLGAEYGFQVFLTIGGVTKFIPMTGITLPLVSYGGSSVLSTIILLAIIQGLYILREDEGEERERERKRLGY